MISTTFETMKTINRLFRLAVLWLPIVTNAQEYPISTINDSLKKNADAVVRYGEYIFEQTDVNNATYKVTEVITVLKETGKSHGHFIAYLDQFRELKSFSGSMTDASGKVVKKAGKKDLTATAYSQHMASDDKYSYYEYQPTGYPYTVRYEYEIKMKNGIYHYPYFTPVTAYDISVEQAEYQIKVPSGMKIRYKAERMPENKPIVSEVGEGTVYKWSVSNIPALEKEPYSPGLSNIIPIVRAAPIDFCMAGQCGNMSDWNNLGKWVGTLMTGREEISPQLKDKLTVLVADASTDKEKVQRIFEYLQKTTRYVSIQLGIGGYQPMSAADVEKNGFGDCKALSNYMKSMLAAVGIPSVYTVIGTDRENLYTDYADLGQMNHVILAVPMSADTLWLECTNQVLPFNYAHTDIAGHQCLLITSEGGKICRVRPYSNGIGDNKTMCVQINIDGAGNAQTKVKIDYYLDAYESMQKFVHNMSREEQINQLTRELGGAKARISNLQILLNDTEMPDIHLNYRANMERFANKSGNRMFVPFSLLRHSTASVKSTKRKQDIVISSGAVRTDSVQIFIPAGYTPEAIPRSVTLNSMFGDYSIDTKFENNTISVVQKLFLKKGHYPASAGEEFRKFLNDAEKGAERRVVLKIN